MHYLCAPLFLSYSSFILYFFIFYWFERETSICCSAYLCILIGCLLYVPWLEIEPTTLVPRDDTPTHWDTQPGLFIQLFDENALWFQVSKKNKQTENRIGELGKTYKLVLIMLDLISARYGWIFFFLYSMGLSFSILYYYVLSMEPSAQLASFMSWVPSIWEVEHAM